MSDVRQLSPVMGDVRGVADPTDPSTFRLVCLVSDPSGSTVTAALAHLEVELAASADLVVPRRDSGVSTVPFDLVLQGILQFDLPIDVLGPAVGQVDRSALSYLRRPLDQEAHPALFKGTTITGPLDRRWSFKDRELAFVDGFLRAHGPRMEIDSWNFDLIELDSNLRNPKHPRRDALVQAYVDCLTLHRDTASALPDDQKSHWLELGLDSDRRWNEALGPTGSYLWASIVQQCVNSTRQPTPRHLVISERNIFEMLKG